MQESILSEVGNGRVGANNFDVNIHTSRKYNDTVAVKQQPGNIHRQKP